MRLLATLGIMAVLLTGCVANKPYRTSVGVCGAPDCSIERHPVNTLPLTEYLLGFVEFDDQGEKQVRAQMDALFAELREESRTQDLCLIVFVHGWEHNASYDDENVEAFRTLLEAIARGESQRSPGAWGRPRKVVGIYAGWRGRSVKGDYLPAITFWGRKNAAGRVALGSVRELLGRARAFRNTIDRTTWSGRLLPAGTQPPPGDPVRSTRLLTIGHSFGGLIVYTALAQFFTDQAAASATAVALGDNSDADKRIASYGDLVVIVNPAVEAISWEPIRQIVENRPARDYACGQPPVFIEVTSTADLATGIAFPLGRSLNVMTESFTSRDERDEAKTAVGHYAPFWTHDLTSAPTAVTPQQAANRRAYLRRAAPDEVSRAIGQQMDAERQAHAAFESRWREGGYLRPGWERTYTAGAVLTQRRDSRFDPNDPFWIVHADATVIAGHSDIGKPVFTDFIRQIYDDLLLGVSGCSSGG